VGAGTRGSETSQPVSTSPARVPVPWPSCMENIEPCMRRSIGPAWSSMPAGMPPGSPGMPASPRFSRLPSCSSCDPRAVVTASVTPAAIGSTRSVQTGIVASTHSAALQATPCRPGVVRSVTASSQSPATWTASAASRWSALVARVSPWAETVLRAMSVARVALTACSLSGAENIAWTWPMTIASICGSTLSRPMPCIIEASCGSRGAPPVRSRSSFSISGGSAEASSAGSFTRGSWHSGERMSSRDKPTTIRPRWFPPVTAAEEHH